MTGAVPRWVEVSRSEFTHELEGLSYIRERLPAAPPYRAWTNLTFTDSGGAMHEVDALVLGRGRLHLVELKHYRGTLAGNENKWLRNGNRIESSPLLLARRKAQRLSGRLRDELKALARERRWDPTEIASRLPFIQDSVFLHARDLEVRLDGVARSNLFAFGGRGPRALPDIMTRLLEPARDHEVRETDGLLLAAALTRMGIQPRTSTRRAGSWVISGAPIDAGDGWQDWRAEHAHNPDDKVRIRVFLAPAGAPQSTREALHRRVKREFGLLQGLSYDSILRPREFAETDEGEPSLIYPTEARFVPLDELVESSLTADQHLVVLERVADAVAYAHRHRVAHRGLNPHAVLVATQADSGLTVALRPELAALVDDLRDRLESDPAELARFRTQHAAALTAERSAASWTDWSTDQLTQAAVGWLLTSVFVRFCEDNRLLGGHPRSRTPGVWITSNDRDRRQQALDAERAFYLANSDVSYREWLETAFAALSRVPATAELVGSHSAIGILKPSSDAVNRVQQFWRRTDDNGYLEWDFADDELSTRFLGDLYQDLSEFAKDKYALLQTPEFVEEFILDQTIEPALKDRPLEGFKVIDPTCGSGHFLLGAFRRLLDQWDKGEPGLAPWVRVQRALDGVYGVDLNPFAVAIARFRLIVAALQAAGERSLLDALDFRVHVAVGDSLLHGVSQLV